MSIVLVLIIESVQFYQTRKVRLDSEDLVISSNARTNSSADSDSQRRSVNATKRPRTPLPRPIPLRKSIINWP